MEIRSGVIIGSQWHSLSSCLVLFSIHSLHLERCEMWQAPESSGECVVSGVPDEDRNPGAAALGCLTTVLLLSLFLYLLVNHWLVVLAPIAFLFVLALLGFLKKTDAEHEATSGGSENLRSATTERISRKAKRKAASGDMSEFEIY
jgi:hypothetical protein